MRQRGFIRRHRVAIASGAALLMASGAIVAYAVAADGYRSHRTHLNDGGIWVTSNDDAIFGRINKPIGQADAAMFGEDEHTLDVVQQGAAVIGLDRSANLATSIDPTTVQPAGGAEATLPADAQVVLAGGTLAVLDRTTGQVRATRVDTRTGRPDVGPVSTGTDPLATVGKDAALTVTTDGVVHATSAATDRTVVLRPSGGGFVKAEPTDSGLDLGAGLIATSVGARVVYLDASGRLVVAGGGTAALAPGSVLQQPGGASDSVLVAGGGELLEVDLDSGKATALADGLSGSPTAPVRLGPCAYGAWSGGRGEVVVACADAEPRRMYLDEDATDLVWRVNRGEILLNDRVSGGVWNVDEDAQQRLDDWDSFLAKTTKSDKEDDQEQNQQGDKQPPKAKPDDFGARPGRLSVLHPLDNDSAPPGRILAIRSVEAVAGAGEVSLGPDGQTVQIRLPADATGATTFDYVIDDGRSDLTAKARVTVRVRDLPANRPPRLRDGFESHTWVVPSGGTLDVPVLSDWRDPDDSDPVSLASVDADEDGGAVARPTATGRVRFTAPPEGGIVKVSYAVSDGVGEPVSQPLTFRVQEPDDPESYAAVAEPDIVSGEVGEPITITPLANDLPGSDPLTPEAVLELAGKVASVGGAEVKTDLVDGTITFRTQTAKTYLLDYDAAYGSAPISAGRIRVDVHPKRNPPPPPVAMPDDATLFGSAPTMVDVLANDVDPTGSLLVTTRAKAASANQVDVAVVQGRWVRISARQGSLEPAVQVVTYTISNGLSDPVEGEITVTQRAAVPDNTPVTSVDRAVVRAGSAITSPVLDNDFSPAGDQLSLVNDLDGPGSGQLDVTGDGTRGERGSAYVAGRLVRYVAPPVVDEASSYVVHYVATNAGGQTAPGTLEVTVVPAERRNQPPEPPVLEGRTTAGDTVKLRVPGVGVDPDGDAVTLTGITSAPALGRIVRFGANSLEYQAYPGQGGTDEFRYRLVDSQGEASEGTVRVAVVPVGTPQPPLAVADDYTAAPGAEVRADVLANDLVASGDYAQVSLVGAPADGVRLDGPSGPIFVTAPDKPGRVVEVVYRLSNGIDTSQTTLRVRAAKGYNNPPVAFDAFGTGEDADAVTVDVLTTAYDPDGPKDGLTVTDVYTPAGDPPATIEGGEVTVRRGDEPHVVPFRVEDADGGAATGSIFVPAAGNNAPYVRDGAVISLDPGETVTERLEDYVVNPAGGPVTLSVPSRVSSSPATIGAAAKGKASVTVTAPKGASGPGAVIVEVIGGDSAGDPSGVTATLSIPVQVGVTRPIITCPDDVIEVTAGTTVPVTVAARCHVWTIDPEAGESLTFEAEWSQRDEGLSIADQDGSVVSIAASAGTPRGSRGELAVTAGNSAPAVLRFVVTGGPPPSLTPIEIDDMESGEQRTIDLAPYLQPGVGDPEPTVLEAAQITGLDASIAIVGATQVRISIGAGVSGRAEFAITMSDVSREESTPERQVEGRITLDVLGPPDTPPAPTASPGDAGETAELSWRAPADNGSRILYYEVQPSGGRPISRCSSTSCEVDGLDNGTAYTFQVRAVNAVGPSEWSARSSAVTPDAKPGIVGQIRQIRVADHTIKIGWTPPTTSATVDGYYVVWNGRRQRTGATSFTATGLDNNIPVRFKVFAYNKLGSGPVRTSASLQSQGPIGVPGQPTVTDESAADGSAVVTISWPEVPPNGPGIIEYRVLNNGTAIPGCDPVRALSCTLTGVAYDGAKHEFRVGAAVVGETAQYGAIKDWYAVGKPDPWGAWSVSATGNDNEAVVDFTAPNPRASQATVSILVNGSPLKNVDAFGTSGHETFTVPGNAVAYNVSLQICNNYNRCSATDTKPVTTYGPLRSSDIVAVSSIISGRTVAWQITFNSNGNPAQLRVAGTTASSSGGVRDETFQATGPGQTTITTSAMDFGYSSTERIVVNLADFDPKVRGPIQASFESSRTDDPPPRQVTIAKGAACQDGTATPCNAGNGTCDQASCARLQVTWANFFNPESCDVQQFEDLPFGGYWNSIGTIQLSGNGGPTASDYAFSEQGRRYRILCSGQLGSNEVTW